MIYSCTFWGYNWFIEYFCSYLPIYYQDSFKERVIDSIESTHHKEYEQVSNQGYIPCQAFFSRPFAERVIDSIESVTNKCNK